MPIATAADVATKLRRDLTTAEQADVTEAIQAAIDVIEAALRRTVAVDAFSERKTPLLEGMGVGTVANGWSSLGGGYARIYLSRRPVSSVTSVVDTITGATITTSCRVDGDTIIVPTSNPCQVAYVAGDDPTSPIVKRMIVKAISRELFMPAAVSSGAYSSYSVEGSSFTANAPAPGESWPLNSSEMQALRTALGRTQIR